ncbi:hypothetical protein IKD82_02620 [Candidatus Saccharibacteria bacterium]|nr:hypothetical protein [Candidatus Saccharibacteria bacterium]
MNYAISFWLGVIIISLAGTLSHFIYKWTHQNKYIGLFVAVNESTWEHIKIALTPSFLWGIFDGIMYGASPNYFLAKFLSLLVLIIIISSVFYSYLNITKKPVLFADVCIFYTSIILSQLVFYVILVATPQPLIASLISGIGILIIFIGYMILTIKPPKTALFKDPITNKFGFFAQRNSKSKKTKK